MTFDELEEYAKLFNEELEKIAYDIHPKLMSTLTAEDILNPKELNDDKLKIRYHSEYYNRYCTLSNNFNEYVYDYIMNIIKTYSKIGVNLGFDARGDEILYVYYKLKTLSDIKNRLFLNDIGDNIIKPIIEHFSNKIVSSTPFWNKNYTIHNSKFYCKVNSDYHISSFFNNNKNNLSQNSNDNEIDLFKYYLKQEELLEYKVADIKYPKSSNNMAFNMYQEHIHLHLVLKEILDNNIEKGYINSVITDKKIIIIKKD